METKQIPCPSGSCQQPWEPKDESSLEMFETRLPPVTCFQPSWCSARVPRLNSHWKIMQQPWRGSKCRRCSVGTKWSAKVDGLKDKMDVDGHVPEILAETLFNGFQWSVHSAESPFAWRMPLLMFHSQKCCIYYRCISLLRETDPEVASGQIAESRLARPNKFLYNFQ